MIFPVFTSDPVLTAHVNSPYIYEMTSRRCRCRRCSDDNRTGHSRLAHLYPGSNSGILMGIPTLADVGSYAIVLKVNDGHEDVMQGFALVVSGPSGIKRYRQ